MTETEEEEQSGRGNAEGRVSDLEQQLQTAHGELDRRLTGIRYLVGDAIVRAARPSKDTLLLPLRLGWLAARGVRRFFSRPRGGGGTGQSDVSAPLRALLDAPLPAHIPEAPFVAAAPGTETRPGLSLAVVADEISWRGWQYEARCSSVPTRGWKRALEAARPDVLLVESTWQGEGGAWGEALMNVSRGMPLRTGVLPEMIRWCRRHDVPTVFYSKEDPTHLASFVEAAREFDYVFTTDAGSLESYRRALGHDRIDVLPFAVQPRIHNPTRGPLPRDRDVFFAGAWYAEDFAHRRAQAEALLEPALEFGLELFVRPSPSGSGHQWPERFESRRVGSLPYVRMALANKCYKIGLNLNSVSDSATMLSRRIFELLASGTVVLSSPARAIEGLFGEDLVRVAHSADETQEHLRELLGDDEARERLAVAGVRHVLTHHTVSQRLDTVLEAIGLRGHTQRSPRVDVIAPCFDSESVENVLDSVARQQLAGLRPILCAIDSPLRKPFALPANVRSAVSAEGSWGLAFVRALEQSEADWIALMHPNDYYGPHYLTDQALAIQYADAAVAKPAASGAEGASEAAPHSEGPAPHSDGAAPHSDGAAPCSDGAAPWSLLLARDRAALLFARLQDSRTLAAWVEQLMQQVGAITLGNPMSYIAQADREERGMRRGAAEKTARAAVDR